MGPVWALVLLLLPVTQGVEGYCDARQNKTQCYGALGGTIEVRLMDTASEVFRCMWRKKSYAIFEWKNKTIHKNELKDRSVFTPSNGTLQINNLTTDDTDTYYLEFYKSDGEGKKLSHELLIQVPVSSVHLELECLSKGEVRATCTALKGDSQEYIWTLNGQLLTDSQLTSKNSENNITLRQEGLLGCSVKNHISHVYKEKNMSTCGYIFINCTSSNGTHISDWVYEANNTRCIQPTAVSKPMKFWPNIIGVLALIVFIAGVGLICVLKKRCKKDKDDGQDQELTYADIRILQQPGRRLPQTPEVEVEYGQVRFSNQSQHIYE